MFALALPLIVRGQVPLDILSRRGIQPRQRNLDRRNDRLLGSSETILIQMQVAACFTSTNFPCGAWAAVGRSSESRSDQFLRRRRREKCLGRDRQTIDRTRFEQRDFSVSEGHQQPAVKQDRFDHLL